MHFFTIEFGTVQPKYLAVTYLGRIIVYDDRNILAARRQLARACAVFGCLCNAIAKEGVPAPMVGIFYQVVVRSRSLSLQQRILGAVERTVGQTGKNPRGVRADPTKGGRKWIYPNLVDVLYATRANLIVRDFSN